MIFCICSFILPREGTSSFIASGSDDKTIRIWSLESFSEVLKLEGNLGKYKN